MDNTKYNKRPLLFIVSLLAAVLAVTPWSTQLDNIFYDLLEVKAGKPANMENIVVVGIDELSFQQLQKQWPWPRSIHAKLIEQLSAQGAKVIAFDLLLTEQSTVKDDNTLANALKKNASKTPPVISGNSNAPTVIIGTDFKKIVRSEYSINTQIQPLDLFVNAGAQVGHVSIIAEQDGFVRRIQPNLANTPSLAFSATQFFQYGRCCDFTKTTPKIWIDFSGETKQLATVSYYQALNAHTDLPKNFFKDKIVFVGVTSTSAALPNTQHIDHYPTPLTRQKNGYTAGVIIHAYIAASLLNNSWNTFIPRTLVSLLGFILAVGFIRFFIKDEFYQTLRNGSIVILITLILTVYSFTAHNIYIAVIPIILPLLSIMLFSPYYNFIVERRRKQEIRKAFSTYVNESIVTQIENNPESLKLGGKQIDGSVLFMDIAGFSTLSEKESPEVMISFINDFLSSMIEIGMHEGGTVERFLGDAIMLIWGAPIEQPNHAELACQAAIKMQTKIQELAEIIRHKYGFDVSARIGINSGSMTAGNIGGKDRFCYTVLGDCVNLAARLEAANKTYQTTIIAGENTAKQLGDHFYTRLLDITQVKGRDAFEKIYELVDLRDNVPSNLVQAHDHYKQGLMCLHKKQTEQALQLFKRSEQLANLPATSLMITRCSTC